MALPALDPVSGRPPVGRFPATLDEVEARFVTDAQFAGSSTRRPIWDSFVLAKDLLLGAVAVPVVWLSGSFLSDRPDPADIDCTFFVSADSYAAASPADQQIVDSFVRRVAAATGGPARPAHGIPHVDSFLLPWMSDPAPSIYSPSEYTVSRGYWDDWWSRHRPPPTLSPTTAAAARVGTFPRRGYLEVELHGYT